LLTGVEASVSVGPMTHCNSARATNLTSRILSARGFVVARQIALIGLVLVLLITNGGAG